MADQFVPSGATKQFADISAFVADGNAINAATKTALNTAITNISNLMGVLVGTTVQAAHPDFNKIDPVMRNSLQNELTQLIAAVTAHA